MNTIVKIESLGRRHRRSYEPSFKADVVAACQQPGVSVAAVALNHGLNANLLRRWITEHERLGHHEVAPNAPAQRDVAAQFIPLNLPQQQVPLSQTQACEEIVIDLQRDGLKASVRWPISQAQCCAGWLREVLR